MATAKTSAAKTSAAKSAKVLPIPQDAPLNPDGSINWDKFPVEDYIPGFNARDIAAAARKAAAFCKQMEAHLPGKREAEAQELQAKEAFKRALKPGTSMADMAAILTEASAAVERAQALTDTCRRRVAAFAWQEYMLPVVPTFTVAKAKAAGKAAGKGRKSLLEPGKLYQCSSLGVTRFYLITAAQAVVVMNAELGVESVLYDSPPTSLTGIQNVHYTTAGGKNSNGEKSLTECKAEMASRYTKAFEALAKK